MISFVAAAWLVVGCATYKPHMMPAPVVFKDERLDFAPRLPPDLRSTRVRIFYASVDRSQPVERTDRSDDEPADALHLGVADVRLGPPEWRFGDLLASDRTSTTDNLRPATVETVYDFGPAGTAGDESSQAVREFLALIDRQLERAINKEVVFYVHGYRVTFDDVAVTMGSFEHYLGHGAVVFFRWPTGINFWNYTDCARAERHVSEIARVIALLARSRAQGVNLMAYSCGSPLLARALVQLRARHPTEDRAALARRYRLGNVIFAASDVDFKTFAREHVPPILDLAQQTIVYMSRNDRALWFSNLIAGASRLGRPDVDELHREDVERLSADPRLQGIDVSDVRGTHEVSGGARGHGYWYANAWIATDVTLSLRKPIPPSTRCLVRIPGRYLWHFPDNYPECLRERLLRIAPELRREALVEDRAAPAEATTPEL